MIALLLAGLIVSGVECGSLFKEITVESRQDLACCQGEQLLSCNQVDLDVASLGDQDLELSPLNVTVEFKGMVDGSSNSYHYENDLVDLVLSVHNGDIYGHMAMDNGDSYIVEYCGNGVHVIKQLDVDNLGEDNSDDSVSDGGEFLREFNRALTPEERQDTTTIVTYSVKIYYTPTFARATADMDGYFEQVIQETNQGYINSKVPLRAKLCCSEQATFDDRSDKNALQTLYDFKAMKGSPKALRGSADTAALIVIDFDSCGYGYTNSIGSGTTVSVAMKRCALGYYSFGHEIGHNIGLTHNKEAATNRNYPYGHGHLIAKGSHYTGARTVLAYNANGHRSRVNWYSNPNVNFPTTGTPTGVAGVSNNAKLLTENRFALAAVGDESECSGSVPTVTTTTTTTTTEKPASNECVLSGVTSFSTSLKYLGGKSKAQCMQACTNDANCFKWVADRRNRNQCYHQTWSTKLGGLMSVLNLGNANCALTNKVDSCESSKLSYQWNSPQTVGANTDAECHMNCVSAKCTFWKFQQGLCMLYTDKIRNSSYWNSGTKVCPR